MFRDTMTATIMIVDDEPANLLVLETLLSQQGYTVRSFTGGKAALKSAQKEPPDLILLDIRMPEMDGYEVCSRLKANTTLKDIPVIFLSAVEETEGKVRAFELGAADFITKPFQAEEVVARIDTHLAVSRYRTELEVLNRELEARVQERTEDLLETNKYLRKEIETRRLAQAALAKSEEKYRSIVTTTNEGIITVDKQLNITFANEAIAQITGGTADDLVGHSSLEFIPAEDYDDVRSRFEEREKGMAEQYEGRIVRLDNTIRWVLISFTPIMDSNGRFQGAILLFSDITDRKHAEAALRQSKEFNHNILMSLRDHIAVLDQHGNILAINDSWIKFAQKNDAGSMVRIGIGANYIQVCKQSAQAGSDDAQAAMDGIHSVMQGQIAIFKFEYSCHSPDKERWFSMTVVPYKGRKGGLIVSHHDITQIKQSKRELEQALAEIAQLKNQIEADNIYLQEEIKLDHNFDQIIGNSDEIKYVLYRLEQVAKTDSVVIILGETGTGKELFARALHNISNRADRPLIKVNCATLPEQFIESELFGHVKGAFTDARKDRQGRFELADKGTLFLDEIGEIPLALQAKLLRVLQDGEFERLGDNRTYTTDVRIIAATNRDLETLAKAGKFRQDLWYRLNVFPISIPPLRDRKADIPLLVKHFVRKLSKRIGNEISTVPETLITDLMAYDWPGNVRELEHVIERAVISSTGKRLQLTESLVSSAAKTRPEGSKSLADMEHDHILHVLDQTGWVIDGPAGAAKILDIHPNTMRYRMKKLGICRPGN